MPKPVSKLEFKSGHFLVYKINKSKEILVQFLVSRIFYLYKWFCLTKKHSVYEVNFRLNTFYVSRWEKNKHFIQ